MVGDVVSEFSNILTLLPNGLALKLNKINIAVTDRINEIRVRRNAPIAVVIKNTTYFADANGDICDCITPQCEVVDDELFDRTFLTICEYSIHSNMENLKNGFVTLPYGARVGIASTAVCDCDGIVSVKNVTSMNIRIPTECTGCSRGVLDFLYINAFPSVIIAGLPNSGKTTLLRDMGRQLSSGFNYQYRKVVLIDERNELAAKQENKIMLDVGANTDVLTGFPKSKAIEIATRTLSPELIICDEVATTEEVESIVAAFSSGIKFALSVHIGKREDLLLRPVIKELMLTGEFDYVILLDKYSYNTEIIEVAEILNEICRNDRYYPVGLCSGQLCCRPDTKKN